MIFLDTCYFKGLMDERDVHHNDALKINDFINDLGEKTVINTTVLVETLNWTVKSNISPKDMYCMLHDENHVVTLTDDDYMKSLEINAWFENSINYSDGFGN